MWYFILDDGGTVTGQELESYRRARKWTQARAAEALGVSQTYLSLLENGRRQVSKNLQNRMVRVFGLSPTEVPTAISLSDARRVSDDQLASELAALGYGGFSHLKRSQRKNPVDVLLAALNSDRRDRRLVEALPWVVLEYPELDWGKLIPAARAMNLQNRLGFVTNVARRIAEHRHDLRTASQLKKCEAELERSLLVREDTLCNETMTNAERKWLKAQRPRAAKDWRLLTDLSPANVNYYVG